MHEGIFMGASASKQDPRATVASWLIPGVHAGGQHTELVSIEIPGMKSDISNLYAGDAQVIQLLSVNVDSTSTDYDITILNKGGLAFLDTVYEVFKYTEINMGTLDSDLGNLLIRNRDDPLKNMLYVFINNDDGVNATGDIRLELGFLVFD